MKKIAIITARSGSKGLKNKNIRPICGKPLLAYSVEAAVKSGLFDRVILSTDSDEYGAIGEQYGAEYLKRSAEASGDKASSYVALKEVLETIGTDFDYFMLLQPTSPLRDENHIAEACAKFEEKISEFDFLVSMREAHGSPDLMQPLDERGGLGYFDKDYNNWRRQDFHYYTPNGAIYIAKPRCYLEKKHFFGASTLAYLMDEVSSVDVDKPIDFELANLLLTKKLEGTL